MVFPLLEVSFALAPLLALVLECLLTNFAGFLDSQMRITSLFFLINFALSSVSLPVVFAFVCVLWPLAGKPSL